MDPNTFNGFKQPLGGATPRQSAESASSVRASLRAFIGSR
jgi:hypothetical protein